MERDEFGKKFIFLIWRGNIEVVDWDEEERDDLGLNMLDLKCLFDRRVEMFGIQLDVWFWSWERENSYKQILELCL